MPLVHLGDLKGLTPLQQGRRIFKDYDRYGDGVVEFLTGLQPEYSPQAGLLYGLRIVKGARPPPKPLHWVNSYDDMVDYGLVWAAGLMQSGISHYLSDMAHRRRKDLLTDMSSWTNLNNSLLGYSVICETAFRRIESRNPVFKSQQERYHRQDWKKKIEVIQKLDDIVNDISALRSFESDSTSLLQRLFPECPDAIDIAPRALRIFSLLKEAAKSYPGDKKMETLLESAEAFYPYASEAYVVTA